MVCAEGSLVRDAVGVVRQRAAEGVGAEYAAGLHGGRSGERCGTLLPVGRGSAGRPGDE